MYELTKSGCELIDELLEGGYSNNITTIYGPAASGKTTIGLHGVIENARDKNKVIFIDTENGFSVDRLRQMSGDSFKEILNNTILFKISNFYEQTKVINKLKLLIENINIKLLIVDTIGAQYRLELAKDSYKANWNLDRQLRILSDISNLIPIIITEQVYQDTNERDKIVPVGGMIIQRWSTSLIELTNPREGRRAILRKHPNIKIQKEIPFIISDHGIIKK